MESHAKLLIAVTCGVVGLSLSSCVHPRGLPDPRPAFETTVGQRQPVELKTFDVQARSNRVPEIKTVESVVLRSGNKQLSFRNRIWDADESFELFVDGKVVGAGKVFYVEPKKGVGAELSVDRTARSVTSRLVSTDDVGYAYTLRPLADGKVAIDFAATKGGFSFCFFMNGAYYRNAGVSCDGAPVQLLPLEVLTPRQALLREVKDPARIEVAPGNPLASLAVELGKGYNVSLMESRNQDASLWIWIHSSASTGSFTLDFGATAVQSVDAPPPVAGVDFWRNDRTHVPAPTTCNLMPNPSFEQGLRHWTWWFGGGKYVPTDKSAYSVSGDARFGNTSLLVRNEGGGMAIMSFPVPVEKGAAYTVSFHAKSEQDKGFLCLGVMSALRTDGSKMGWQEGFKYRHALTTDWQRYAFTFTSDTAAISLLISPGGAPVRVDGIQVEKGTAPSEYTGPDVEGSLRTSDPDCMLALGQAIEAGFDLSGKPETTGTVEVSLSDYYRETLFRQAFPFALDKDGRATVVLPFDALNLGTGIFIMRVDYRLAGQPPYSDYYRFSIMDFLANTHATKNLYGNLFDLRHTRADDLGRNYRRWGFGSTSYNFREPVEALYGIRNFTETIYSFLTPEQRPDYYAAMGWTDRGLPVSTWTEFTPERLARIEDICYDVVKRNPAVPVWAPTCEIEGTPLLRAGNYDEWGKFQVAAFRGIKRANPAAIVLPDTGTSGLNRLRGFKEQEGYLRSTQGKVKWDAMAAHPYGSLDGVCGADDLDANTAQFIELMKKYGYGPETPIFYTEGFNITDTNIPEWGSGGAYDNYGGGRASYDTGWREFIHAAWVARTYLICLKYWPQVQQFNIWVGAPFFDLHFAPLFVCGVPNTLGHLLANPTYKADIRPVGGIRGYAFEDDQGRGVAAIWCAMDKVDNGLERGPEMLVKFAGPVPEFIDLMGNLRRAESKDGMVTIQLTSAPLFLRSGKGGLDALVQALNTAQIVGAGSALTVDVQPQLDGQMECVLINQTNNALSGKLVIGDAQLPFDIPSQGKRAAVVPGSVGTLPNVMYTWRKSIGVEFANGKKNEFVWDVSYFYVPRVAAPLPMDPDAAAWQKIPSIPMTNWFTSAGAGGAKVEAGYPHDLDASFQLAWDADNLYLRVSGTDDALVLTAPDRWSDTQLYMHDGSVEVYLDTGANGRSNPGKGYDLDDYRYDFYAGDAGAADGPGSVHRLREVHHQLAGGLSMPTKAEAAKGIPCQYRRTKDGYAYVMMFPQRYIEPLRLEKGWRAGFGLYLHDKEADEPWPRKGLSLATEPGSHCDYNPHLWPVMILAE